MHFIFSHSIIKFQNRLTNSNEKTVNYIVDLNWEKILQNQININSLEKTNISEISFEIQ